MTVFSEALALERPGPLLEGLGAVSRGLIARVGATGAVLDGVSAPV
jgi:hypothetical protein